MSLLQARIEAWLSRRAPERALNQCFDLPVVLATDIGLRRTENQDRVATMRISAQSAMKRSLVVVAVADGMGGMRDGAKCASLALSSFFYGLTFIQDDEIESLATKAIRYANETVFRFAGGKGGATLSAVLLNRQKQPFLVHLGDSRIYAFGEGTRVERLTTDDSLAEAVGGHGRELLQFVGMGDGMLPHVKAVPINLRQLAITTDGIHFIEPATLESLLANSPGLKGVSERLAALARWCGGPDNASSAVVDLQAFMNTIGEDHDNSLQLSDPFGNLSTIWLRTEAKPQVDASVSAAIDESSEPAPKETLDRGRLPVGPRRRTSSRGSKTAKAGKQLKEKPGVEIHIEQSAAAEEPDEDRR